MDIQKSSTSVTPTFGDVSHAALTAAMPPASAVSSPRILVLDPSKLTAHPEIANDVEPMCDGQFEWLETDMRLNGQHVPATVTANQLLVDGLQQQKVAIKHNLPLLCYVIDFPDGEAIRAYRRSRNVARRHLTEAQRAAHAVDFAANKKKLGERITIAAAAKTMNISARSVQSARFVKRADPALFEEVRNGMPVHAAVTQIKAKRGNAEASEAAQPTARKGESKPLSADRSKLKLVKNETRVGRVTDHIINIARLPEELSELCGLIEHGVIKVGSLEMLGKVVDANWSPDTLDRVDRAMADFRRAIAKASTNAAPASSQNDKAAAAQLLISVAPVTLLLPAPKSDFDRAADDGTADDHSGDGTIATGTAETSVTEASPMPNQPSATDFGSAG